jgi:hypothetical protein
MCIPHATPVSATKFTGLNIPSLVFSTCGRFPPSPTTTLNLQILTEKLYLAPTVEDLPVLESHFPLYNLIPQKILSYIPSDLCVIPHSITFKMDNSNVRPMNGKLGRKSYKIIMFQSISPVCLERVRKSTKAFNEESWSPS